MSKPVIDPSCITPSETIIVGLSGGPDSVFLLHQLVALQRTIPFKIIAAHLNHEWRPTAQRDQEFCETLCNELHVTYVTQRISELNAPEYNNRSQEAQGRYYRKFFLESIQQKYHAHKIFVGHHQDDQIETFFIKLIRGTTLEGLGSLKTISKQYYRPLLHLSKQQIVSYLHSNLIPYVHDESNDDPSFLRNRIRHKLVPLLVEIDHRALSNTLRAIESIQESNTFIEQYVHESYSSCVCNNVLNLAAFHTLESFMQKKVLLQWLYLNKCSFTPSSAFVDEILRFFTSAEGGTHRVNELWSITKKQNSAAIIHLEQ